MRILMKRTRNFVTPEDRRVTIKYRADGEYTVRREHGEEMVEAGEAVEIEAPARVDDAVAG
jgi:hypothetical protein